MLGHSHSLNQGIYIVYVVNGYLDLAYLLKLPCLNSAAGWGGRNLSWCIRGYYQGSKNRCRFTLAQRSLFNTAVETAIGYIL